MSWKTSLAKRIIIKKVFLELDEVKAPVIQMLKFTFICVSNKELLVECGLYMVSISSTDSLKGGKIRVFHLRKLIQAQW